MANQESNKQANRGAKYTPSYCSTMVLSTTCKTANVKIRPT